MEFLEKLYSQEYFAPVLFTIIAILAVLFIIVLILALRDAKKKKNVVDNTANDAFAKVNDEAQEVNINATSPEINEIKEEKININNNDVVSSVETTGSEFKEIEIPAPIADNNESTITSQEVVTPSVDNVVTPEVETPEIKIETPEEVVTEINSNDVAQAENDLDSIAATLLSEYKKDNQSVEVPSEEVSTQPSEFSSVGVTPDVLPAEEKKDSELPSLNDIPVPQPVRVTDTSTIIDSSKQNIDNIQTEEYSINK